MFNLPDVKTIKKADIGYLNELLFDSNGHLKIYSYEDLKEEIPHDHISKDRNIIYI